MKLTKTLTLIFVLLHCPRTFAEVTIQVPSKSTLTSIEGQNERHPVKILETNQEEKLMNQKAFELRSEDRIPIIFFPYGSSPDTKIILDAPKISDVINQVKQKEVDFLLSGVMGQLNFIQALIQKRRLDEALDNLTKLEATNPNIHYFEFTKASILLLQGNRDLALTTAKAALKFLPENEEGKEFIRRLERTKP